MQEFSEKTHKKLAHIFGLVTMSDMPAMADHVQELIAMLGNRQATADQLSEIILKDYSLTTKVLQTVNSAYYSRGESISTISRAITAVGFEALRALATAIAIFEEFSKRCENTDNIRILFTQSFVSATQSRILCNEKKYKVSSEDAFICTLLYKLGKAIVLVYVPDRFVEIEQKIKNGHSEDYSAKSVLDDLTYTDIGKEVAKYWNFAEKIIASMDSEPPNPEDEDDSDAYLPNLSAFNNNLTAIICNGSELDLDELLYKYGKILSIEKTEALKLVEISIKASENASEAIRFGLTKLNIKKRIMQFEAGLKPELKSDREFFFNEQEEALKNKKSN